MTEREPPPPLYAGKPDSLEPPVGRRALRPSTAAMLAVLIGVSIAAIVYHLGGWT